MARLEQSSSLYHADLSDKVDLIRVLRRHNHSSPSLIGQVVQARVLQIKGKRAYVDAGFHALSEIYLPDVTVGHIIAPARGLPLTARTRMTDIRVGDLIRLKVEALYTPYGDMQLQPAGSDAGHELHARWTQLVSRFNARTPVEGRVLNQCRGGYAVGVAGFVALLPYNRASPETCRHVGALQAFFIDRMDESRRLITLLDARLAPKGPPPRRGRVQQADASGGTQTDAD